MPKKQGLTQHPPSDDGRRRVVIENLLPRVDEGRYPIRRVIGESVRTTADILSDGHDVLSARLLVCAPGSSRWDETPMVHRGNDHWEAKFTVKESGEYQYTVAAWVDSFESWRNDFKKRHEAKQDLAVHLLVAASLVDGAAQRADTSDRQRLQSLAKILRKGQEIEVRLSTALGEDLAAIMGRYPDRRFETQYEQDLTAVVERRRAHFGAWYERFPRSCSSAPGKHGTLRECLSLIPEIARMGFDVVYLPPIHPIGVTNRKGKNNSPVAAPGDVGSPWAIGSSEGGHKSIHPQLGTFDDLAALIEEASKHDIEVALDLAFQCSPDHPYVKDHPEWFVWLPDGSVQHAENPPKKYEDVLPLNFNSENWRELWDELKSVVLFWAERGIRVFRVDNPHTKPFPFWEWLIKETKRKYPDLVFLSEAFTRPKIMYRLAKAGFAQGYTYFTWRNTKAEFTEYITHLLNTEVREFFRPNFWPNTPDILPEHLQFGGRPVFVARAVLAATLSSSYGIYGPAFELCVNEAVPGTEEYLRSEKYELKHWDWDAPGNLKDFLSRLNAIRRDNAALQTTWNLIFHHVDNDYLLAYSKVSEDLSNVVLIVVNLDPHHPQSGWVTIPLQELGISTNEPYLVHELLGDDKYIWQGERNFVAIDPHRTPAHILRVRKHMKRETDFDYFL
jgi:starch synthase (maltosyl-transferring)